MHLKSWLAFLCLLHLAAASKILTVLPVGVRSHSILFDRLVKELAKRGHEITYITPFSSKSPTPNIEEILIPDCKYLLFGNGTEMNSMAPRNVPGILLVASMPLFGFTCSRHILEFPAVQQLINSDRKFDLVFGEPYIDEAILAGFSHKHGAPIVVLNTLMPTIWSSYVVGNPTSPSFIPDPFTVFSSPMNLLERTYNLVISIVSNISLRVSYFLSDRVMRSVFGNEIPHIGEIMRNTSLLLVNHHPSLSFARPQTPNTIDVAGMHIYPPKPLPQDLEEYMKKSPHGVVLFSLGSNFLSKDMSPKTIQAILGGLGRLKENVLWKFEGELENLPKNVKIAKWLPQSDILAHPSLKMFITHGGLLSTTEAVWNGVPVVGIPVMADQPINMAHTENAGLGLTLNMDEITEDLLYEKVTQVLNNPKYRTAAKAKSRLLRDTPLSPLESAVWWIEFVLRNKGASHLRPPSQDLCWLEYYNIDAYILLIAIGGVTLVINYYLLKITIRRCCWKRKNVAQNKNHDSKSKSSKKTQ